MTKVILTQNKKEWTNNEVHVSRSCDQRFNNHLKLSGILEIMQIACGVKYHSCQHYVMFVQTLYPPAMY